MTYQPRHEPYAHQAEALRKMEGRDAFALLMAMRTGKTKVVLDDFGRLWSDRRVDDLHVVAPAGVYRTWEGAVEEHVGDSVRRELLVHTWSAGDRGRRAEDRERAFMNYRGPRLLLTNIEAMSTVARAKELAINFASQRRCMGVVDESTKIKNDSAARTKFVVRRLAPLYSHRRILSGLVSPKSPLDVFSQFQFLRPGLLGFSSFFTFRSRYAILRRQSAGGRSFDVVVGFRDEEELYSRMAPHSHRVRLEDCYDMPPNIYQVREVQMTDEQRRVYGEIRDLACSELEGQAHVTATQVITQILRMHQVLCGHVGDENGNLHEVPENRTEELLEVLDEWDDGEGKAIIWCSYDHDVRKVSKALADVYGADSVARFWGGNRATREDEEASFKRDPRRRFMVATASAGGMGRTWSVADHVVYYSNTPDLEHRSQSEERPRGVGKTRSVLYTDLVAVNGTQRTVDWKFLTTLRNKINMASTLQGDGWREWVI